MTVFNTAGKLCSWSRLVPANNESSGRQFSTCISKGGHYLKPFLVSNSYVVVKSEKRLNYEVNISKLKETTGASKKLSSLSVADY